MQVLDLLKAQALEHLVGLLCIHVKLFCQVQVGYQAVNGMRAPISDALLSPAQQKYISALLIAGIAIECVC